VNRNINSVYHSRITVHEVIKNNKKEKKMANKTYSAKPLEIERKWYVIDAEGEILGRLAARIANILRGKNKPEYTPNVDTGDFVIVINAEKVVVSGNKETDKIYYHHTGFPGGLKSASVKEVREKDATKLIEKAVKGMLQHNTLGAEQFNKLKVYCGPEHPHAAQKPVVLEKEAK
jgi:large subunit ribosomal protein L13